MQVGIDMGTLSGGEPAKLDIEELLATRLLVQGNSGSGKSHLLRRLLEQSAQWVQQVIIDPEGDFVTLSDRFGHLVVDGERTEAELAGIANRIRIPVESDPDYTTVAGYVIAALKRIPELGESFEANGWRFEVIDLDGRRIDKLLVSPVGEPSI